jgi:hypothetical protein
MKNWKLAALLAVAATVLVAEPAIAQTTVDLRPAVNSALEWVATALTTVLTVLGGFAIRYVSSKTGLANSTLEASLAARLDDGIHKAIGFALTAAQNEANKPGSGVAEVKFNNWFLSVAASYLNTGFPEIIATLKLTDDRIRQLIMARLQPYMAALPVDGAVATPPIVAAATAAMSPSAAPATPIAPTTLG